MMKTLVVYYSKSGNTRAVAEKVQSALSCDVDEIRYQPKEHRVSSDLNPADYDLVILMCPIWAFRLSEPMALYLQQQKASIKRYRLAVTCGGFGLRGCVSDCKKILHTLPETTVKIKQKAIQDGTYSIDDMIKP